MSQTRPLIRPNAPERGQMAVVSASTTGLPHDDKFEFWRELTRQAGVEIDCTTVASAPFDASAAGIMQDEVSIVNVGSSACRIVRDPDRGVYESRDALLIYFVTTGRLMTEQDGRSALLQPGEGALYVADRPFVIQSDQNNNVIALKIPRVMLPRQSDLVRFTALPFGQRGRVGTMLYSFATGLCREAPSMDASTVQRMTRIFVDLLDATFDEIAGEDVWRLQPSPAATLARIKTYIHNDLTNPELRPARVSARMKLSLRYLNRLFESEGTSLARYIWDRRLERVALELANPARHNQSMIRIATSFGFKNQSHFSHAFRTHFGVSPTEYRRYALAGVLIEARFKDKQENP